VGPERVPLSLVSTTEELLGRKSSGSGLESREYGRRDPSRWPRGTLYQQNVGTNFAGSVGIFRSRNQAKEFLVLALNDAVTAYKYRLLFYKWKPEIKMFMRRIETEMGGLTSLWRYD
jgi:hypothetical protein